jgi:uncharacterized alpha-E superfamily protein
MTTNQTKTIEQILIELSNDYSNCEDCREEVSNAKQSLRALFEEAMAEVISQDDHTYKDHKDFRHDWESGMNYLRAEQRQRAKEVLDKLFGDNP